MRVNVPPRPRMECREFRCADDPSMTEARVVDVLDPDAAFPAGTVFECPAGHKTAELVESMHRHQRIEVSHFAPSPPYQATIRPDNELGTCLCGRSWAQTELIEHDVVALHVRGRGWVHI